MRTSQSNFAGSTRADTNTLDRRNFVTMCAAGAAAALTPTISRARSLPRGQVEQQQLMGDASGRDTFVLVPGAWHGGWVWRKMTPHLRAFGAEVFPVTNTGLGDRVHLGTRDTNLTTHVTDVVNVLECNDLTGVTLVGHSYGGMVISGVADRVPQRIAHLVYLDAFLPTANAPTSLFDLAPGAEAATTSLADRFGDGWRIPQTYPGDPPTFGVTDAEDAAWLISHLAPQPLKTFAEKLVLAMPLEARAFTRTYILASVGGGPFPPMYDTIKDNPAWQTHVLPTAHDAMVTRPFELARILEGIVHNKTHDAPANS